MAKKDYQEFKIKINMKTILLYEEMSGRSFYVLEKGDFMLLIYCSLVVNNDVTITYPYFESIMSNEKICRELVAKCQAELDFIQQFQKEKTQEVVPEDTEVSKVSDIVNLLVLQYGIDINYVMLQMRPWELTTMMKSIEEKTKADMVEKRFWTYLNICPHIDSKKVKGPEQLIQFPWEKKEKEIKQNRDLENNRFAIKNMIGKNIFGEPVEKEKKDEWL